MPSSLNSFVMNTFNESLSVTGISCHRAHFTLYRKSACSARTLRAVMNQQSPCLCSNDRINERNVEQDKLVSWRSTNLEHLESRRSVSDHGIKSTMIGHCRSIWLEWFDLAWARLFDWSSLFSRWIKIDRRVGMCCLRIEYHFPANSIGIYRVDRSFRFRRLVLDWQKGFARSVSFDRHYPPVDFAQAKI